MEADTLYLSTCAGAKLPCCDQSHALCHSLKNVANKTFTPATTQPAARSSSDTLRRCHSCGAPCFFSPTPCNQQTSLPNPANPSARATSTMPSSLTRYVDPYIDHTRYYAFPPISASTLPDIPRIGPSTASAIDPAAPELDAAGEISPLDELHIHLNDTKSQANFEQICESNYQAQPVYDPSLTTDSYYEHSSYLPSQETISPYLLNHPGDVYYEPPSSNLHNMELLDIDFDNSALETLPALTYTLASPQMGNMSTTTNAIDASPLFSIPDTTLALDGIGTCYGESSIVGDMFPPYLTGLDSVNLPQFMVTRVYKVYKPRPLVSRHQCALSVRITCLSTMFPTSSVDLLIFSMNPLWLHLLTTFTTSYLVQAITITKILLIGAFTLPRVPLKTYPTHAQRAEMLKETLPRMSF